MSIHYPRNRALVTEHSMARALYHYTIGPPGRHAGRARRDYFEQWGCSGVHRFYCHVVFPVPANRSCLPAAERRVDRRRVSEGGRRRE